jgi:GT2 family glycosyltransferase
VTDLSIIIVTYKGWRRLDSCLAEISSYKNKTFPKEIIIIDNTPDEKEISVIRAKYPFFKYIHNNVNGGYGYAVNRGAEICRGEFLLVLNPDTVATEESVDALLNVALQNTRFTVVSCRQVNEKGKESTVAGSFPEFSNLTGLMRTVSAKPDFASEEDYTFPDWVSGSVMLFRRDDFNKLKGFDEDFWMYFEDVDICRRVVNSGGTVAIAKNILIEHNHGGSSRTNLNTAALTKTEVQISRHVYINKHKSGFNRGGIQLFLVVNNICINLLLVVPGIIFFFIPKIRLRVLIALRLTCYYLNSAIRRNWISPRSINFNRNKG